MHLEGRLRISIAQRTDDVFLRTDFAGFGSEAQVSRALRHLVEAGVLVKLGVGVYAKAKRSALSGQPIPIYGTTRPTFVEAFGVFKPAALACLGTL